MFIGDRSGEDCLLERRYYQLHGEEYETCRLLFVISVIGSGTLTSLDRSIEKESERKRERERVRERERERERYCRKRKMAI